eukprot:COSAG01_NODE_4713_length_4797_cov_84.010856_4_plen_60_part_00
MLVGSACHIYANYCAVACLQFDTFNARRGAIAVDRYRGLRARMAHAPFQPRCLGSGSSC